MNDSQHDPVRCAYDVICSVMEHHRPALLTTASRDGIPHATWMATMTSFDFRSLLTLTSPDSRKVANIRANPRVEWLFTDAAMKQLVYLEGTATLLEDVAEIKAAWHLIPDKERAYFLSSFNSRPGFAIVETKIESVIYCRPEENRKHDINPLRLAAQTFEAEKPGA